ncbi:MAG: hypothetical protein IBX47_13675, partial [Desulfuromonadales bacterium]|nr:hypothetical protein [Desulfuromonadales bacterium]
NTFEQNRYGNVILGEEVPDDFRLPGNYWGSTEPEQIAATFYDGRRDEAIGRVIFTPFLPKPAVGSGGVWSR